MKDFLRVKQRGMASARPVVGGLPPRPVHVAQEWLCPEERPLLSPRLVAAHPAPGSAGARGEQGVCGGVLLMHGKRLQGTGFLGTMLTNRLSF